MTSFMTTLYTTGKSFKTNYLIIIFSAKINLISYSLSFLSSQLRPDYNAFMETKSTKTSILKERGFPPTHFPALLNLFHTIRTSNTRKKSSCFLRKALYAGQGDLTHQSYIPEEPREKWGPGTEMTHSPKVNQRENENWVLFLKDWNSIVTRLPCYWATMHFHIAFKILEWGDHFI